jgi:hypothetical protein
MIQIQISRNFVHLYLKKPVQLSVRHGLTNSGQCARCHGSFEVAVFDTVPRL